MCIRDRAASAAAPTEAPSAAPADIAEPQRILPGVDTAAWDKSEAVAATIDTEYRNTDHRMVAVPMLGTVTNDYFNTVTFAGDSLSLIHISIKSSFLPGCAIM